MVNKNKPIQQGSCTKQLFCDYLGFTECLFGAA